jgi:hypothetical protein
MTDPPPSTSHNRKLILESHIDLLTLIKTYRSRESYF